MALTVLLTRTGGAQSPFYLKAEHIEHVISRTPFQVGFPSASAGIRGQIFTLDLGMATEQISFSGIVDVGTLALPYKDADGVATKEGLELAVNTWWGYGADSATGLATLTIGSTVYTGSIKIVTFRQDAALEDRWHFDLVFVTRYTP